jgi:hypothetical protein
MQTANTKQVRSIVRGLAVAKTAARSYTDKLAQKNMRTVVFVINKRNANATLRTVKSTLQLAGFNNSVAVTHTEVNSYLRIKAAFAA